MTRNTILSILVAAATLGSVNAGEGRIPIWKPTTITQSGHYIVTRNIDQQLPGGPVLEINSTNVQVDLNGFTLAGSGGAPVIRAIGQSQITIRNGHIESGTYGIEIKGESSDVVIEDLVINQWSMGGILLDGAFKFTIRRNKLGGISGEGILVQAPLWGTDGVIEDNHLRNGGGITLRDGAGVAILHNRLHDITVPTSSQGAIHYENASGGRIAGNVINYVTGSGSNENGIYLNGATACEVRDNSVTGAGTHGIVVEGGGNLVLENTIGQCSGDGVRIAGSYNQIDRNLLVGSGFGGAGGFGLHFVPGGSNNTYGRNTARGNAGGGCLPGGGNPATTDFCDESLGNSSFNDNHMPTSF